MKKKFLCYMQLCPRVHLLMSGLSVAKLVNDSLTHIFSPNNFPELQDSTSKCLNVSSLSHRLIKQNILKTEYPLSLKHAAFPGSPILINETPQSPKTEA